MDWRLSLTVLILAVDSGTTRTITQHVLPTQQAEPGGDGEHQEKLEPMITNRPHGDRGKVTATVGSKLPPKHEIILNLPAPDDQKDLWKELDHMKMSSKFRNAALGSSIVKVKHDDGQIQNTDGANPRLPPFAFSEDSEEPEAPENSQTTTKVVDTTSRTPTRSEELHGDRSAEAPDQIDISAKEENMSKEKSVEQVSSEAPKSQEKKKLSTSEEKEGGSNTPAQRSGAIHEVDDSVVERAKEPSATEGAKQDSELFNSIAEYNKWIVEKAAKRKQIKENGYKKYQQIMFKSGRNIVPVRLFFDTDPLGPPRKTLTDDFAKRSISSSGLTNDKKVAEKLPVVDDISHQSLGAQGKEAKQVNEVEKLFINSGNTNVEPTTVFSAEASTTAVPLKSPSPTSEQPKSEAEENSSDEMASSGMTPPMTSESQEELLFLDNHETTLPPTSTKPLYKAEITPPVSTIFVPNTSTSGKLSSDLAGDLVINNTSSTTSPPSSKLVSETAEIKEKQTAKVDAVHVEHEGNLEPTTTTVRPTTSTGSPLVTVPLPVASPAAANRSNTLPPLLSMPSLKSLSSFSSLNAPVDIATKQQPPSPKKTAKNRRIEEDRKKSSGVLGLKNLLQARNQKRKLSQHRTPPLGTVDSDRKLQRTTQRGRPQLDRSQFIKTRQRKVEPRQRPNGAQPQPRTIPGVRRPNIVANSRPGAPIFESTFTVPVTSTLPPKRVRVRTKQHHLVSNTPVEQNRQRGIATDLRSAPTSRLQTPTVQLTVKKSAEAQPLIVKGGISLARGHQKQPNAIVRTLAPPLTPNGELKVVKPSQRSLFPVTQDSEWDHIRAEFLRIKRQHKKLYEMQRKSREQARMAGVKTLTADSVDKSVEALDLRSTPPSASSTLAVSTSCQKLLEKIKTIPRYRNRKGQNSRRINERRAKAENGIVTVDVDRSRRTVDRDVAVRRV